MKQHWRGALAVLASVAAVASLAVGTQALQRDPARPAEQDAPATGVVPYALRLAEQRPFVDRPPSGAPACRAADLVVEAGEPASEPARDGRLPRVVVPLALTNRGAPCQLDAEAAGAVVDEDGRTLALSSTFGRGMPAYAPPPALPTGGSAATELSWSSWCGPDPGRWSAVVEVGGRLPAPVPGDDPPVPPCAPDQDGAIYGLGLWTVLNDAGQPLLDPQTALVGTLELPPSAPFGGTLEAVLRLTNPTRGPIALDPCPQFTWSMDQRGPGAFLAASPGLELNCPAAPDAVPAGGHVDFALELPLVPALADGAFGPGAWFVTPGLGGVEPQPVTITAPEPAATADPAPCTWVVPPAAEPRVPGLPPTTASRAPRDLVLETDRGPLTVALDAAGAPCAVAALAHLVEGGFFDGQPCYELSVRPAQFRHLDCGANEYEPLRAGFAFPTEARDGQRYPAGTVLLSKSESITDAGSLRVLFGEATTYLDSFVVVGRVTDGLELVEQVAAGGQRDGDYGGPALPLTISSAQVRTR